MPDYIAAILYPCLFILSFVGIIKYHKKWQRDQHNTAVFKEKLVKPKNQLRNVARIRNIYLVLERTGNAPGRIASFKSELEHRLLVCEENLDQSPKNSQEALVLYNKMRS